MKTDYHTPVLLSEITEYLRIKKGEKYIDATLGGGGHTEEFLKRGGIVLGIDTDQDAIFYATKKIGRNNNFVAYKGNFKDIEEIAHLKEFTEVRGVVFDLGVSSHQIDTPNRGFSFLKQGPLDMRMDRSLGVKARDLVNILTKGELYELFNKLGQEHRARSISDTIIRTRRVKQIETTKDLGDVIKEAYGIRDEEIADFKKNELFKRVFQGLRIAVNNELENIEQALPQAMNILKRNGRIAVISFHSLEDKIVKDMFRKFEDENMGIIITKKPILPSEKEQKENPRSKSAKLRIFEKN